MNKVITAPDIKARKGSKPIAMLTAYDYPTARLVEKSGIDLILVGDSLAMVVLGREDTLSLTVDEMLHHVKAVARGCERALVVADMPFLSYEPDVAEAVRNAGRMLKEGGARAVKLESASGVLPQVRAIIAAGIPVMGHVGLTPQRVAELGGFKVQGREGPAADRIVEEARALDQAGCFAIVLEAIPADLAARITAEVGAPTIGIGAGPRCDGQVLVYHDVVGLFDRFVPKFVKKYADVSVDLVAALTAYREEVEAGTFPDADHSFGTIPAA
ncbi:MAG: 3-methyl-2-oxobutanoate hydroxymethyltransferase [Desulfovibrionaceae bacterium]|jgi:3-methyl-2-oxobutanoate hydroxymethyltransferase|nr:3-methyl-2-oxobutanoate hydroxymethyltransferase [Desulfovibrionaceae bacterium]